MVDCLVLNYNDAFTVRDCILRMKEYQIVRKIVVVDNCSTDDSLLELKKYASDKIEVISTDYNGGYGYGNNFGIKYLVEECKSKYILLCNPDTIILESTVNVLYDFLNNNKDYAIVAPVMHNISGQRQINTAIKLPSKTEYSLSLEIIYSKLFKPMFYKDISNEYIMQVGSVSGSLFMMNADIMYKYGMYDENIFLYNEEIVLGKKMHNANFKVGILTKEKFIHNHAVSISKTYNKLVDRQKILIKSHKYVTKKYFNYSCLDYLFDDICCHISLLEHWMIAKLKKSKM